MTASQNGDLASHIRLRCCAAKDYILAARRRNIDIADFLNSHEYQGVPAGIPVAAQRLPSPAAVGTLLLQIERLI